jgi:hypothetical protein
MKFKLFAVRVRTKVWPPGEEYPKGEWLELGRIGGSYWDARFMPPLHCCLIEDRAVAERWAEPFGDRAEVVEFECMEIKNADQRENS